MKSLNINFVQLKAYTKDKVEIIADG